MAHRLTKKNKDFADAYLETGNATLAAKESHAVTNDNSAAVTGSRVLRNSKVREYIEDKAELAATYIFEIASAGDNDNVRLNASKDILDRAGFKPIDKSVNIDMNIRPKMTDEELKKTADELLRLQKENS